MRILAVIPARGGSKGIKDKNIKRLSSKPLVAWTIQEAKKSKYIDRVILSSESKKIINIALRYDCDAPFVRPKYLAGDRVRGVEPLIHAVRTMPAKYDYVVLLQCTSPLRSVRHIDSAIEFCLKKKADSCISVCRARSSVYLMQTIDKKGRLKQFIKSNKVFYPRQLLPKVYEPNGAIYIIKTETLLKTKSLINKNTLAYVMKDEDSLDIDNLVDFALAEVLIKLRAKKREGV